MSTFTPTFTLTMDFATNHLGIPQGASGRNNNSIVAICLHSLNTTLASYLSYIHSDIQYQDLRPQEHGSVHYAVEVGGAVHQFVRDTDTAWGLQELHNATWPLLTNYAGIEPDYLFVHIGLESFSPQAPRSMFIALAQLIAYIALQHNISIDANHVISHTALDDTYPQCARALLVNVIAVANSYATEGNDNVSVNVAQMSEQLAALQTQVDLLSSDFYASQATIENFAAHPSVIASNSILGHIKASDSILVNASTGVASVKQNAVSYQLDPNGTLQTIVPNISAIVQYPVLLSDDNHWATLGSFQNVQIDANGLYRVQTRIRLLPANWTQNSTIFLSLYKNNILVQVFAVLTLQNTLTQATIEISGECFFNVTNASDFYDIRIITTDNTLTTPTKQLASGNFVMEKIGA